MTSESSSSLRPAGLGRLSSSWPHSKALWAGVSIATMWLAVLFVGVFGGNLVFNNTNGYTSIPVVVALLPFVLPATIAVGRRGFTSGGDELHTAQDEETEARERKPTAEQPELRTRVA